MFKCLFGSSIQLEFKYIDVSYCKEDIKVYADSDCQVYRSKEGLIKQLEYEGFTHEESVYGVTQTGL